MDIRKIVEWVVKGMYITLVSYILLVYKDNFKFPIEIRFLAFAGLLAIFFGFILINNKVEVST